MRYLAFIFALLLPLSSLAQSNFALQQQIAADGFTGSTVSCATSRDSNTGTTTGNAFNSPPSIGAYEYQSGSPPQTSSTISFGPGTLTLPNANSKLILNQ